MSEPTYVTVSQAAELAGVTPQAVRAWLRDGKLVGYRRGHGTGKYLIDHRELRDWLTPVCVDPTRSK